MELLNKIGQRNAAKYLIFVSVALSLLIYLLKLGGVGVSQKPNIISILIGTIVFCLPNVFLYLSAVKSKEYRLISVFSSALIVFLNAALFSLSLMSPEMSLFLFAVSLIETLITIVFLVVVSAKEKKRQTLRKTQKTKTVTTEENLDN